MADEALVVGAQDEASGVLAAIERQIMSLTAGVQTMAGQSHAQSMTIVSGFQQLAGASVMLSAGMTTVLAVTTAIGVALAAVAAVVVVATAGLAAMALAVTTVVSVSNAGVDAFMAQEESINGLRHALSRYVDDADAAVAKQRQFASQLQEFSGISDESTLALQRQAAQLGYSEEQIQALVSTAAGLKGEFGIEYAQAFEMAKQATMGNSSALESLIPEMRFAYTEAQRFELVQRAAARGMEALADQTDTTAGKIARSKGYWGDLSEVIGSMVAPVFDAISMASGEFAKTLGEELAPAVEWITAMFDDAGPIVDGIVTAWHNAAVILSVAFEAALEVLGTFASYLGVNEQAAESWGDTLTSVVTWASEGIIAALTWVEVILTNLPAVFDLVAMGFELMVIGLIADAEHAFTVALPAYLEHYTGVTQEWANGFILGLQMAAQIWLNALLMPWYTIQAVIPGVLAGINAAVSTATAGWGASVDFAATAIGTMPEVAARQLTERETELQNSMGAIATSLSEEFGRKFDERVAKLGVKARENMVKDFQDQTANLQRQLPRLGVDTSQLNAVEARFLTRGTTSDPLVSIEANTLRTAKALEELPEELKRALERQSDRRPDGTIIRVVNP